jgi:hypothetical protein
MKAADQIRFLAITLARFLTSVHSMDRCWLQGALGDALHAVSCAAGYNLRWLLRAIARLGLGSLFLRLLQAALMQAPGHPQIPGTYASA